MAGNKASLKTRMLWVTSVSEIENILPLYAPYEKFLCGGHIETLNSLSIPIYWEVTESPPCPYLQPVPFDSRSYFPVMTCILPLRKALHFSGK